MSVVVSRARRRMTRIAFPEGNHPRILRAAQELLEERICTPVLLGNCDHIREQAREAHLAANDDVEIIDPPRSDRLEVYARAFYDLRPRSGISSAEALYRIRQRSTFAAMIRRVGGGGALGPRDGIPLRPPERGCERAHLTRSEQREHRLQAALAARRG